MNNTKSISIEALKKMIEEMKPFDRIEIKRDPKYYDTICITVKEEERYELALPPK